MRAGHEPLSLEDAAALPEEDDLVPAARPDRLNEPAAFSELFDEGRGNGRKCGRDEDRVVWRALGEPACAVADNDVRVLDALPLEVGAGRTRDVLPALDAPDLAGEAGEECRLPAEAGSDLEHAVGSGESERLDHTGDQGRLRRHLVVGDRQRRVPVCERGQVG